MDRQTSRSRRCALLRRRSLKLQHLEERRLLATITWDSPTGGSWLEVANWDLGRLPEAGDDVVIPNLAGDQVVTLEFGTASVDSVTSAETLILDGGGELTVSGNLQVAGSLELRGGTLRNATLLSDLILTSDGGTLDGITVSAGASLDASNQPPSFPYYRNEVTITGGLMLDGDLLVGSADDSVYGEIVFEGTQTLSGSGTVTFGGDSLNGLYAGGGGTSTLTIGSGISIVGTQGNLASFHFNSQESIINEGTIDVDMLTIDAFDWMNDGTINADSAAVTLDGSFSTAALGNFSALGGTVELEGTLDNTGDTLNFAAGLGGDWLLRGGTIQGGTLDTSDGSRLILTSTDGTLDGVIIGDDLVLDGTVNSLGDLKILNGLVLNGTLLVGNVAGSNRARIYVEGTQSITGTGTITFGNSSVNTLSARGNGTTVTMGPGVTINGLYVHLTRHGFGDEGFDLQGTIEAEQQLTLAGDHWTNSGSITADGAQVTLDGTFTTADLATFSAAGGMVHLEGTLDNTGQTFTLSAALGGDWELSGGTIQGGTIASADGSKLLLTNSGGTIDGVTVAAGATLSGTASFSSVEILNDLILNGIFQLGAEDGSSYTQATFRGSQTLSGTGTVMFGSREFNTFYARNSGTVVTVGSDISIQGHSARLLAYSASSMTEGFILNGTIVLDENFKVSGAWDNNGTIDVPGAIVSLGGYFSLADLGTFDATGADVTLEGTLDNTGTTLTLQSLLGGDWTLAGGTILGGTLASTDGFRFTLTTDESTFDGVTIDVSTVVDGGNPADISTQRLTVLNGLVLNGTLLVGAADGSNTGEITFEGTQSLSGTGTVTFGLSMFNRIVSDDTNGTTLTLEEGLTINGSSGRIKSVTFETIINRTTIALDDYLEIGGNNWVNEGTIEVAGAEVKLVGTFTTDALGNFNATGANVTLAGTLLNQGRTFWFQEDLGTWRLDHGTIEGGTLASADGSRLLFSGNNNVSSLENVTVDASLVLDGTQIDPGLYPARHSLRIIDGVELNGTILLGNQQGSTYGWLYFEPDQTLNGSGIICLGTSTQNEFRRWSNGDPVVIGSGITIEGGTGTLGPSSPADFLDIEANLKVGGGGKIIAFNGLEIDGPGHVYVSPSSTLEIGRDANLLGSVQNPNLFAPRGTVSFMSSTSTFRMLEVMGQDLGLNNAGFSHNNFTYGVLTLNSSTEVQLVDLHDNAPGTGNEALYVNSLVVPSSATLDLNGLNLYARAVQIEGTILNGTVQQLPETGNITLGEFVPAAISDPGELDEWSFYGLAGSSIFIVLNPSGLGTNAVPGALGPQLQDGHVEILAPDNTVLASADGTSSGEILTLENVTLPVNGTYRVRVRAADSQSGRTGNYNLLVQSAIVDEFDLLLNQRTAGQLSPAFNTDAWNFHLNAGEQIRFNLLNTNIGGLAVTLEGPDGYIPFSEISDTSDLITIPADKAGSYRLTVRANGDQLGNYAFEVQTFAVTDILPNSITGGTLQQSGDAQLFRVVTTTDNPLLILLDDTTDSGRNEIYLKQGAPPTRADFHYRYEQANTADPRLLTSQLTAGEWYILVYGQEVPSPSPFTLQVESTNLHLVEVSPHSLAADQIALVEIVGAGFVPGTQVTFIESGGTTHAAQSVSIDSFTRLSATLDLTGLAEGAYDIEVELPDGSTALLADALEVLPAGLANFEAELILPEVVGRQANATLYVEYINSGTVAMPAPLLVLQSADELDLPLLTLDQHLVPSGFWSNQGVPYGFGHSVQIYASGEVPGILQPGETVRVPVYYIGLARPWDLSDQEVDFEIRIESADSTDAIDWVGLEEELRPSWVSDEAWPSVFANLQDQLGSTWGEYVASLGQISQQLRQLGRDTLQLEDLYGFALQQADALSPLAVLDSTIDIALATPGLPLAFSRTFSNTISGRYQMGSLGYGWSVPWQIELSVEADASVILENNGEQRRFAPDRRYAAQFLGAPGDQGRLTLRPGDIYELTESNGQVVRFRADGKLDYLQDTHGNRITAGYTGDQLTSLTHSSGATLTLAYTNDRISTITGSDGQMVTYTYDATFSHLLSVVAPGGTTTYTYSSGNGAARQHALLSISDSEGVTRHFSYDPRGWLTDTYLGANQQALQFTYNEIGHVTVTDAEAVNYELRFDEQGRIVRIADAAGNYTRFEYNALGQLIRETDTLGRSSSYSWHSSGGLSSITDELGQTTTFMLGGPYNLPAVFEDALGNRIEFTYDASGNLLSSTYADGTSESAGYDADGNLTTATNRRSETVTYTYNALGQVTEELRADGSTVTYTYDPQDRLETIVAPEGTTTYDWNTADQLTRVDYPGGRWVEFDYDSAGRRIRTADETGFEVNYEYDLIGRLAALKDAADSLIVQYTYDAAGRLVREDKGNGTATTYDFDTAGRLTSVEHLAPDDAVNARFDYTYDAANRRATMSTLDGDWAYTYDARGQLIRAVFTSTNIEIPDQDLTYEYDALGNRIRTVMAGETSNYSSSALNQYRSVGETNYSYDLDGNLIEEDGPDGIKTYTYNSFNQLVQVDTPDGTWEYEYDAFGNRIAKVVDGVRTEFLLDPTGIVDVLAEYDAIGNRTKSFAHGLGLELASTSTDDYYYDFDALGSTAGLTGAAGSYVNEYAYQPFGRTLLSNETVANSYEYVGEYGVTNEDNGLHFMRARFYDASLGRFTSKDPLRLGGGDFNFYRYAANNPVENIDPLGLFVTNVNTYDGTGCAAGQKIALAQTAAGYVIGAEVGKHLGTTYGPAAGAFLGSFFGPQGTILGGLYGRLYGRLIGRAIGGLLGRFLGSRAGRSNGRVVCQLLQEPPTLEPQPQPDSQSQSDATVPKPPGDQINFSPVQIFASSDPNDKYGASGYGPQAFIKPDTLIPYRIEFENLGAGSDPVPDDPATAPAQRVEITDQLSDLLDWQTLAFTEFGFGDFEFTVPEGRQYYFTTVPMMFNGKTFDVEIELSFNSETGVVRTVFQSIDPNNLLPPDVLTGFLPPEDGTGRGMGHVGFTINPLPDLPSGTEIRNVALISFDGQTIIATNQVNPQDPSQGTDPAREALNTIDAGRPASQVTSLQDVITETSFPIGWSGGDDLGGSGIASYSIYVSDNGGAFELWQENATASHAIFTGERGHTYAFYSVARDNVGHTEIALASADAEITISLDPRVAEDVDANTSIDVVDALIIINELLNNGEYTLDAPPAAAPFWDVDNNGELEVVDALLVINYLLNQPSQSLPESATLPENPAPATRGALPELNVAEANPAGVITQSQPSLSGTSRPDSWEALAFAAAVEGDNHRKSHRAFFAELAEESVE